MLRIVSISLLILGTIIGALGGARLPTADVLIAGAGIFVLAAGAVLFRFSRSVEAAKGAKGSAGGEVRAALDAIVSLPAAVEQLDRDAEGLSLSEIISRINLINGQYIQIVSDAAQALLLSLGSREYAALMDHYASGERLLTRAWSAAADEHRPECLVSLSRAVEHFREAAVVREKLTTPAGRMEPREAGGASTA